MVGVKSTLACLLIFQITLHILISIPIECGALKREIPQALNYGSFVERFRKSYGQVETLARAKLFYARTLAIFKLNALYLDNKIQYYLRQNEYTDMTLDDIKQTLVGVDIDLPSVNGAKQSPDEPADEYVHEVQSRAEFKYQPKEGVNFFDSDTLDVDIEPRELVQELASNIEIANVITKVVVEPNERSQHVVQLPAIPYRAKVEIANENYDPGMVPTRGWAEDLEEMSNNYAQSMMDSYLDSIEPYAPPVVPEKRVLSDHDLYVSQPSPVLSRLAASIKNVYDYFTPDKDDTMIDSSDAELEKEQAGDDKNADVNMIVDEAQIDEEPVYDIDWRRTGCIPSPKNQYECNACYVFATLDMMEFYYCQQKKVMTKFSAQFVIDCGQKTGLKGCTSGRLTNVATFIMRYGLQLDSYYPYAAKEQFCPYELNRGDREKAYAFKPNVTMWKKFTDMGAWYKWMPKRPLIVGINMPTDFLAYGGGIHDGLDCAPDMVHAMLLVGSGKQNGVPFWLLKNTFSDSWGENGYFRLSKKAPLKCFNSAVLVVAKFD